LGKFKGNRTSLTKEATKEYKTNSFGVWRRIGERKDKSTAESERAGWHSDKFDLKAVLPQTQENPSPPHALH